MTTQINYFKHHPSDPLQDDFKYLALNVKLIDVRKPSRTYIYYVEETKDRYFITTFCPYPVPYKDYVDFELFLSSAGVERICFDEDELGVDIYLV